MKSSLSSKPEIELHYLKIFNTVAIHQSYTKAALSLCISQPALSMQVKKLEAILDAKLFDKIGNHIELNKNGELLFNYTQQIFNLVTQAEHEFQSRDGLLSGELTIGGSNTPGTYLLPRIIGEFKQLYPHNKVNLHISNTDEIAHLVEKGKLDFAVNGGKMNYSSQIHSSYLMSDPLIIAASPQNSLSQLYLKQLQPLDIDDLNNSDLIIHETNSQLYKEVLTFAQDLNIEKNISYIFGSISSIIQAIQANMGISLIPYSAIELELRLGLITSLRISNLQYDYPYYLIYNQNKYIPPIGKLLIQLIEKRIK